MRGNIDKEINYDYQASPNTLKRCNPEKVTFQEIYADL